ncbi:MAG: 3-deoxy-8-phosphooctulonate synthase [Bacteroidales bacterium]|nr:3-deoxy-8-phosphooctulonate synthase [Bacteroidales bacterium]MDD4684819.1 3-deoxy-8-phosphooctulonate synthase [Bacteroidales bacterium]
MDLYNNIINNKENFFLMAGPCVIENKDMPFEIAEKLIEITNKLGIKLIFKASYRKANRSSIDSFTGIGDKEALEVLKRLRDKYNIPVVTDIHSAEEAIIAAHYVDIIQIPAFLCRQTDILLAAAKTGKIVNVKKGQFLSAESMKYVVEKIRTSGNNQIMLTDRGTMFGYQDLIVDFRSIPTMQENNLPVIMDITHSLQQPNQVSGVSGGLPKMIETIAKAAIAVGADGIFMETHPNPKVAKSDGKNMISLDRVEDLLTKLVRIKRAL